ncbi:MaoC family dehydratase N-terminal domain-containing protein [Pseudomonas asiatica]|uniref:FAS1-like dehydratase domain-containing protein n=1 Tax=Pseudomonas asiatica TaxID=2219225 RepID=UPI002E7C36A5|nr:MaoC family dehydratase N-terminal domain-containing protein [Pseudomonas asiatica]MEE1916347.1 MaoC family dehydratase N-terminal domain-containing protein [Pseudomonas asiatica]
MSDQTLTEDFKKATAYELTDHDIERAKLMLHVDLASRDQEQIGTASIDNIRSFAYACGSDNPLFCNPDYAASSRWGSVIAPSMMAGVINRPMLGDPLPEELKAATKSLFRGIHMFISGGEWTFYRPIFPGDTLYSFGGEDGLEVKQSEFAGRSVTRFNSQVKVNQRGEVVSVYRYRAILTERKKARETGKYKDIQPATYTDEDLARIDEIYSAERSRGADTLYFEDLEIGSALPGGASGPLTVTDVVNFHGGGYGWVPYGLRTGRMWNNNRKRIAPFYVKNAYGVPDVAQRLHWDSDWAQAIGNPMAYDYGVMRENYLFRYLTDWAGDNGWVYKQYDEIRKFNYMGDTQFISGEVVGKRVENGLNLVDVKVKMTNQRGEDTVLCDAVVALPSRDGALVLPPVPHELQARASKMMARHWELSAGKHKP